MGWAERHETRVQRGNVPVLAKHERDTIDRLANSARRYLGHPSGNNRDALETALTQFDEIIGCNRG